MECPVGDWQLSSPAPRVPFDQSNLERSIGGALEAHGCVMYSALIPAANGSAPERLCFFLGAWGNCFARSLVQLCELRFQSCWSLPATVGALPNKPPFRRRLHFAICCFHQALRECVEWRALHLFPHCFSIVPPMNFDTALITRRDSNTEQNTHLFSISFGSCTHPGVCLCWGGAFRGMLMMLMLVMLAFDWSTVAGLRFIRCVCMVCPPDC